MPPLLEQNSIDRSEKDLIPLLAPPSNKDFNSDFHHGSPQAFGSICRSYASLSGSSRSLCLKTTSGMTNASLKVWLLALLVLQGSVAIVTGRYTRSSVPEDELYEISHLVFVIEAVKFVASIAAEYIMTRGGFIQSVQEHIFKNPIDSCKVLVPAVLYVIQNSLVYIALSNLTAPVFISLQQGKLIATALVSVAMLNRSYSMKQWLCLLILGVGVSIVALDEREDLAKDEANTVTPVPAEDAVEQAQPRQLFLVGILAVTGSCFSSAFAGVYFEKVLSPEKAIRGNLSGKKEVEGDEESGQQISDGNKPSPPSLWIRNMQLAFFSLIFAYLQGAYEYRVNAQLSSKMDLTDEEFMHERPYLYGFTVWVWVLVALQAGGGLLVAAVMKYADNVLKNLAMGIGVVVASMLSTLLFNFHLSRQFILGGGIIFTSVYFFSNDIPAYLTKPTESRKKSQASNI